MNELIIRKRWKFDICCFIVCIIGLIWGRIYVPEYRYSFAAIPLIIGCVISLIFTIKKRHEEIVFGKFGITLPDGTLCKWENIRLIELKFSLVDRWCMYVHTKKHVYKENLESYNVRPVKIADYLRKNRREIQLKFYAKKILGVIFASEHPMNEYSNTLKKENS